MPGNKKPKKKHVPKERALPISFGLNEAEKNWLKAAGHAAMLKIETGNGDEDSWNDLTCRLNWGMTMASRNFEDEQKETMGKGLAAVVMVYERFKRLNKWGLSGDEKTLLGRALICTDNMQDSLTRRELRDCMWIVMKTNKWSEKIEPERIHQAVSDSRNFSDAYSAISS